MSWGSLNINAYKAADLSILIKVVDSNDAAYEFTGTNVINVYRRYETTPLLSITLTWDGTYYTGSVDAADLSFIATVYRLEWINSNATTRPIVTGNFTLSDVFTDTRATAEATLTVDTTTFDVTVSDSDVAATAALAAQTAAELAQTGAETAETNAGLSETAASGYATDALGHANDAEASAETALTTIKGVRNIVASETLVLADAGKLIEAEHATDKIEVTIPADTFDDYTTIAVERTGAAEVGFLAGGATVLNGDTEIAEQYHIVVIQNKGGNVWTCIGGVS